MESKSYEVTKEQYELLIEKFNFSSPSNYLMFDNYDNYICCMYDSIYKFYYLGGFHG